MQAERTERFTYSVEDLTRAAAAIAGNRQPGTTWDELSDGEKAMHEQDAEAVLQAVGGRETATQHKDGR